MKKTMMPASAVRRRRRRRRFEGLLNFCVA
jgi:hypothetical protein